MYSYVSMTVRIAGKKKVLISTNFATNIISTRSFIIHALILQHLIIVGGVSEAAGQTVAGGARP